jgi:hypothetical protein
MSEGAQQLFSTRDRLQSFTNTQNLGACFMSKRRSRVELVANSNATLAESHGSNTGPRNRRGGAQSTIGENHVGVVGMKRCTRRHVFLGHIKRIDRL